MVIACCLCGAEIEPNAANMCLNCLKDRVHITSGISTSETILLCRPCGRYSKDELTWITADLESPELLTLCLKTIHGLGNKNKAKAAKQQKGEIRLIDAKFIWTEPHSRRLKVNLVIEKELAEYNYLTLQQNLEVVFVVKNKMCKDCTKETTNQTWQVVVQLRQHVAHKKTLLYLETELLKDQVVKNTSKIVNKKDGLDFYFTNKQDAAKFVEKVQSFVPTVKKHETKSHLGTDVRNNVVNYQFAISLEISPVCRNDCLVLDPATRNKLNLRNSFVLCEKFGTTLKVVDPFTGSTAKITKNILDLESLFSAKDFTEFTILDVKEDTNKASSLPSHNETADAIGVESNIGEDGPLFKEIEVAKTDDFSKHFTVNSHLGRYLKPGDFVLGYDFTNVNFNMKQQIDVKKEVMPEIILVKKK